MTLETLQDQWDALSPAKRRQLVGGKVHSILFWSAWSELTDEDKQRLVQWATLDKSPKPMRD